MTLNHLVHCHLCPLKDFCSSGSPDASWRIRHNRAKEKDWEAMQKASANCPLRRAVAYADTALSQELLKRIGR